MLVLCDLRPEKPDDRSRIANGNLNVGLELDASTVERGIAFLENSANTVKLRSQRGFDGRNGLINHKAISLTLEPVEVPSAACLILRE